MKAFKWAIAITVITASSALLAAEGNGVSVTHYEPLQRLSFHSEVAAEESTQQLIRSAAPVELNFDAMGKSFDLQLEPHSILLSAEYRSASPDGINAYRGQLANNPDSWARIVVYNGIPRGVIWDGSEMYAIEAPGDSIVKTDVPVIYRLADTLIEPGSISCGSQVHATNGAELMASVSGELTTVVAQAPGAVSEITMAAIGDSSFTSDHGGDADAAADIVARLLIVDGYFSEQVGVQVDVTHMETYSDPAADPLTTPVDPATGETDPSALLDDLGLYRQATPAQNSRGLTHLFTGRDLTGTTAGIAFVGSLCQTRSGAGLSEGDRGLAIDALVAAHEIGHRS
jgi:hypothetical protein